MGMAIAPLGSENLTIWESTQNVRACQHGVAKQLGICAKHVRVISTVIGGAFGSRGELGQATALVALAAQRLQRPVKLVATREQDFTLRTFRAETRQHLRLGADRNGKLVVLSHESWELASRKACVAMRQRSAKAAVRAKQSPLHGRDAAVGAFAAGRTMNPRAACSQLRGGQVWGLSSSLHEVTEIDPTRARYINSNLGEYHIPVNADILDVEAIMVPEEDTLVNPLGIKGVGELGATGVNAAIANALHHVTGVRVRELPIRFDKLLESKFLD